MRKEPFVMQLNPIVDGYWKKYIVSNDKDYPFGVTADVFNVFHKIYNSTDDVIKPRRIGMVTTEEGTKDTWRFYCGNGRPFFVYVLLESGRHCAYEPVELLKKHNGN